MSATSECWYNFYASGHKGMAHWTRKDAELAGTPSYAERDGNRAVYRVHVVMKRADTSQLGKTQ